MSAASVDNYIDSNDFYAFTGPPISNAEYSYWWDDFVKPSSLRDRVALLSSVPGGDVPYKILSLAAISDKIGGKGYNASIEVSTDFLIQSGSTKRVFASQHHLSLTPTSTLTTWSTYPACLGFIDSPSMNSVLGFVSQGDKLLLRCNAIVSGRDAIGKLGFISGKQNSLWGIYCFDDIKVY